MDRSKYLQAVGAEIARRRRKKGFSQENLALRVDLHRTYIGSVERGEKNLTLISLLQISSGLDCLPEDILRDAGSVSV